MSTAFRLEALTDIQRRRSKTEDDINNYLEAVFEEPMDRQRLIHTLGVVARARGMMKLSKETGITRAGSTRRSPRTAIRALRP